MTSQQETSNQNEENKPPSELPEQGSNLADRLGEVDGVSEDAAVFMAENWSRFVGFVVLLILLVFGYNEFRASGERKQAQASDGFSRIQQALKEIENTAPENKGQLEKSNRAFDDSIDVLKNKYSGSVYAEFAPLYSAKKLIGEQKYAEAREALKQAMGKRFATGVVAAVTSGTTTKPESIAQELAALIEAKSWLLGEKPDLKMARERLAVVAKNGELISGEALVTLAKISINSAEKEELKTLANEVLKSRPQLREQVESAFTLEGIDLE